MFACQIEFISSLNRMSNIKKGRNFASSGGGGYKIYQEIIHSIWSKKTWIICNGIAMMHDVFFLFVFLFIREQMRMMVEKEEKKGNLWRGIYFDPL